MAKKDELKKEILIALEKRLGKKSAMPFTLIDKKRQMVVDLLYKRIIQDGKTTNENIIKRIDEMYAMVKKNASINDEIVFNNLKKTFTDVSKESTKDLIKVFNTASEKQTKELATTIVESSKKQTEEIIKGQLKEINVVKPKWYKEPSDEVTIKNKEIIFTKSDKQKKEDVSTMSALATAFLESLVSFFTKLAKQTFKVRLNSEHYTTPQAVILLDPKTMKSMDLKELGFGSVQQFFNQNYGGSGQSGGATDMTATNALLTDIKNNTDGLELKADTVILNVDELEALIDASNTHLNTIENTLGSNLPAILAQLDNIKADTALLVLDTNKSILKTTVGGSASGVILTPTSGKKLKIFAIKFSLSADATSIGFNFQGFSEFEKYTNPKSGGLYGHNMTPNYLLGGTDIPLEINVSGTVDYQVNIDYQEID